VFCLSPRSPARCRAYSRKTRSSRSSNVGARSTSPGTIPVQSSAPRSPAAPPRIARARGLRCVDNSHRPHRGLSPCPGGSARTTQRVTAQNGFEMYRESWFLVRVLVGRTDVPRSSSTISQSIREEVSCSNVIPSGPPYRRLSTGNARVRDQDGPHPGASRRESPCSDQCS